MITEAEIRADERQRCWAEINAMIERGPLKGNGCDPSAQRNGLILAANKLFDARDVGLDLARNEKVLRALCANLNKDGTTKAAAER